MQIYLFRVEHFLDYHYPHVVRPIFPYQLQAIHTTKKRHYVYERNRKKWKMYLSNVCSSYTFYALV